MINVIVSDLDGTLLRHEKQELEEGTIPLIKSLIDQGILFIAASGRQYPNMQRLFEPIKNEMGFICENGSLVVYKGEVIAKSHFEDTIGKEIIEAILKREGCELLLSGERTSYLQPKEESFGHRMQHIVKNDVKFVDDVMQVTEPYLKISVYEKEGIEHSTNYWMKRFGDKATVVTSGNEWLDMLPPKVNKGSALDVLKEKLDLDYNTMMVFGDQNNDIEMLERAGYSYAMENATETIKNLCKYRTKTVEEVLRTLLQAEQIRRSHD